MSTLDILFFLNIFIRTNSPISQVRSSTRKWTRTRRTCAATRQRGSLAVTRSRLRYLTRYPIFLRPGPELAALTRTARVTERNQNQKAAADLEEFPRKAPRRSGLDDGAGQTHKSTAVHFIRNTGCSSPVGGTHDWAIRAVTIPAL